ncbi:MAG: S8 family peptidase [bacterium]|nr:S8 family peptidase [bacterium]
MCWWRFSKAIPQSKIDEIITHSGGKVGSYSELLDFYRVEVSTSTREGVEFFRAQDEVMWANYNYIAQAHYVPNDQYYSYQWHYPLIGMEQAWDISRGDPSVVVAVLDQGWQFDHEDFAGVARTNPRDFISNDNNPEEPNLQDSHGMHTAGTIFAATNNGTGVAGVAPLCTLMPVRVLDNAGSGSIEAIANGFAWAAQQGADVVNASLGFGNPNNTPPIDPGQPLTGAVQQCAAANVVMAVSSGNDNADYVSYPAAYTACIAVGATALQDAIAPYSNKGSELDVTAPGGNTDQDLNQDGYVDGVLSTVRNGDGDAYVFWQGTSMAAPHVAGLAALILAHGCPPNRVRDALQETAVDLGTPGWDVVFGYGRINALAALQYNCQGGGGGETVLFDGPMENSSEGWTVEEDGQNGVGWRFLDFGAPDCGATPHGGQNGLWHDDEQGVGLLDDWLYTPQITIPANATAVSLTFWQHNCYVTPQYYDLHAVYYSTDGNNFTQIVELDDAAQSWEQVVIDATALAGSNAYFAWRYRGDYATEWFLDDVQVTATTSSDAAPRSDYTIPAEFTLGNPFPNPFNNVVQIPFEVSQSRELSLSIYNVMGQKIATLVNNEKLEAGAHRVTWQADQVASGVYLIQLTNGSRALTQKILLVK